MEKAKKRSAAGRALLFSATLIWGSSFFVTKGSLDDFPVFFVLTFRFLIGGALLLAVFHQDAWRLTWHGFLWAMLLGAVTVAAYVLQTYGIDISGSASKSAFLTGTYCVFVPFMGYVFFREKPGAHHVLAAIMCLIGVGLISIDGGLSFNAGDLLSLAGGIFFALQIIVGKKVIQSGAMMGGLAVALLATGVVCGICSVLFESEAYHAMSFTWKSVIPLLYLAVICTCAAQSFQIVGQKLTSANETAVILSLESVFGALFGVAFGGDAVTARMIVGFVLVFAAVLICETKMGRVFERKKRRKEKKKMIRHVVCFRFKESEKAALGAAKELLLSMNGRVPTAKKIAVHLDELRSPRSFDLMLEVWLDDFAALEEYQRDAYHAGTVKPFMHEKGETSISMDFTE